ncbi:unnamed protein product [Vitrella brassicaformis CCMP3155]|uniref:Uncharacterized protein n=1 Tax=Vitrella brassicaformis (strain CCMP3155) TaxID=1169540 RepID=A0A0G4E8G5_VITBC|nr:unnamed protein product [Vitrella brassicaformis CCMP3155]|eukprot:CEL91613.1 unnamed protein product [Vitrella brassicaformis CCMP3155]
MAQDNTHALPLVAQQRSTFIYDHSSACEIAQRLVTHDGSQLDGALAQRVQFIGHTLFREAISRQWQGWTPEQRASVKGVLLSYPTHLPADRLRSPVFSGRAEGTTSRLVPRRIIHQSAAGADIPSGRPPLLPPMKERRP